MAANASIIWGRERAFVEFSEVRARAEKSRRVEREREVVEAVTAAKTDLVSVGVFLVAIDGESEGCGGTEAD